jgi:Beta-propeller repeat
LDHVEIAYRGIEGLSVAEDGSLEVDTAFGKLRETQPQIYQEIAGKHITVAGHFKLTSETSYAFEVGAHAAQYALVIDPTLLYSTYLGGSAGNVVGSFTYEFAAGIAVDTSGSAYVAGYTRSLDFPTTPGAFQTSVTDIPGLVAFITKLNATGTALVYSTYLGYYTGVNSIAVDSGGNAYVTGENNDRSYGRDFPTTPNAYWPTDTSHHCANWDFFVSKINPTGNELLYSTCLGGAGSPTGIAVDSHGGAFITGTVGAGVGLPTTSNAYQKSNPGARDSAFVMAFDTTLAGASSLVYSSYFGIPSSNAHSYGVSGTALALDAQGNFYITGSAGDGVPTTPGALQQSVATGITCNPAGGEQWNCPDAFVAKFNPSASGSQSLIYSTYLGGPGYDTAVAIAVDASGNAFVTGHTQSSNFPITPGAFQTTSPLNIGGDSVSFVSELNAGGSRLLYSTYFEGTCTNGNACGSGGIASSAIAVDALGDAYVAGSAHTALLPVTPDAFQSIYSKPVCRTDCSSAFLTEFNPAGSALLYSSYLGGTNNDVATGVAIDQTGDAYVAGHTASFDFPTIIGVVQPVMNGTGDAFVTKFPLGAQGGLSVTGMLPSTGGNNGQVTPRIIGTGFQAGATVRLISGGTTIVGNPVAVGASGQLITATFNLQGTSVGSLTLVVVNPDGTTVTLPGAFVVQQGGAPNIQLSLVGRNQATFMEDIRYGSSTFFVVVTNTGTVDAADVPVWLSIPSNPALTIVPDFELASLPLPAGIQPLTPQENQFQVQVSGQTVSGLVIPFVPAGARYVFPFSLLLGAAVPSFDILAWVSAPLVDSFTSLVVQGDPNAIACFENASLVACTSLTSGWSCSDRREGASHFKCCQRPRCGFLRTKQTRCRAGDGQRCFLGNRGAGRKRDWDCQPCRSSCRG